MWDVVERIERVPVHCVWELTLRCDLRCLHCGSRAGRARERELTTQEALELVHQLAAEGTRYIALSGGDPFLRDDWDQIAAACVRQNMHVSILTSGWALDGDLAKRVHDTGTRIVSFSIDGNASTHDFLRHAPGSFERNLHAIEAAHRAGLTPVAITQFNRYNIHQIDEIHTILDSVGIRSWQVQITHAVGRAARSIQLRPEDAWIIHDYVVTSNKSCKRPMVFAGDDIGYYTEAEEDLRKYTRLGTGGPGLWLGCYAGLLVVGIESDGSIKGCLSMPETFIEGNIRDRPFSKIWHSADAFQYNRARDRVELGGHCSTCEMNDICRGGCKTMGAKSRTSFEYPYCLQNIRRRHSHGREDPDTVDRLAEVQDPQETR